MALRGGRVSEQEAAACPDLDTWPGPPSRFFVPFLTHLPQAGVSLGLHSELGRGMAGCQGWSAEYARGPDPLTWEMTSLKDDLNSCTSVVKRLTSCPVFLASKKAMSCLTVKHNDAGGGGEGNAPSGLGPPRPPGSHQPPGPTLHSCQYRSREPKRAFRISMAMRSPMWDSSTR